MAKARKRTRSVRVDDFFESAGVSSQSSDYKAGAPIFAQGDPGTDA